MFNPFAQVTASRLFGMLRPGVIQRWYPYNKAGCLCEVSILLTNNNGVPEFHEIVKYHPACKFHGRYPGCPCEWIEADDNHVFGGKPKWNCPHHGEDSK